MTPGTYIAATPSTAASAYARTAETAFGTTSPTPDFSSALSGAVNSVIEAGVGAEQQSTEAINGAGNFTELATALSRAELALQSATAIRDRVVQAYQEIMRMPI